MIPQPNDGSHHNIADAPKDGDNSKPFHDEVHHARASGSPHPTLHDPLGENSVLENLGILPHVRIGGKPGGVLGGANPGSDAGYIHEK